MIAAGDSLLSPSVTRRVIDRIAQQPTRPRRSAGLHVLTPRERGSALMLRCDSQAARSWCSFTISSSRDLTVAR